MKQINFGDYPPNWKEIATATKDAAQWCCVRCGHAHEPAAGYCLTVHHLTGEKNNCVWWNLTALCQRCHLTIQARVIMARPWILPHSEWFRPYVAGYYAKLNGLPDDQTYVLKNMDQLIALGQGYQEEATR